jgi:hypothetical protein
MLQFANQQLLLLFGKYVVRHVTAFDEDARHVTAFVGNRLINEIDEMLYCWLGAIALESYWQSPTNKWCASRVDLVEEFEKALPLYLRESFANRLAQKRARSNEPKIGGVGKFSHVLRPPQNAHEAGRFVKELPQSITFVGKPQIGLLQLFGEQVLCGNVIADDEHSTHLATFVDWGVPVGPPYIFPPAMARHGNELIFMPSRPFT